MYDEQIKENEKLITHVIYQFYKIRHVEAIEAMVRNMGMDFEDLMQLGRIAYFKALKNYDDKGGFNGFFCVIFHNDLKVLARKQGAPMRKADVISLDFMYENDDSTAVSLVETLVDDTDVVGDVMAKMIYEMLDKKERAILLMRVNGYSQRQIGEVFGCSQRHAGVMLERIIEKLKEELEGGTG